jgi:hypothetical protein
VQRNKKIKANERYFSNIYSFMALPAFLLASYYKNKLVIPTQSKPAAISAVVKPPHLPAAETRWYLGENKKQVTIVVNQSSIAFLTDDQFTLLTSVLKACKLNMADVSIVNLANSAKNFTQLHQTLNTRFLLLFDVATSAIDLPFSIPLYQLQSYDQCQILQATSLNTMLGEEKAAKDEKMKLWNGLRKMFSL